MENQRPPRKNSSGQKQFPDRKRQPGRGRFGSFDRTIEENQPAGTALRRGGRNNAYQNSGVGFKGQTGRFGTNGRNPTKRVGPAKHEQVALIPITSDLQVTDGKYRGKLLKNSVSVKFQPTPRRLREILFKVVSRRVRGGRFLDLGSGPGTIGIEAISCGAMLATFVERSSKMCSFIKKNMDGLRIKSGQGEVIEMEIAPFLKKMDSRRRQWDLVYFGTRDKADDAVIFAFFKLGCPIAEGGLLMIEHPAEREFPEEIGCVKKWRKIAAGGSTITFYQRK